MSVSDAPMSERFKLYVELHCFLVEDWNFLVQTFFTFASEVIDDSQNFLGDMYLDKGAWTYYEENCEFTKLLYLLLPVDLIGQPIDLNGLTF